jgi:serine phosphatase RsbU (regulator of sigma subunit)
MRKLNLKLRTKSMLALVAAFVLALAPTVLVGWEMLERGRAHFGKAYARNFTLLHAERIEAPVSRDLALSRRFADSALLAQWLSDETSARKKSLFFQEAAGYRKAFRGRNYFVVSRQSRAYYLNSPEKPYSRSPRYFLDTENARDAWFFKTMARGKGFNINVDLDVHLGETRVWINVIVRKDGKKIGVAGTGLSLGEFLESFIAIDEPGVTPMILDARGMIQAHPNRELISFGSGAGVERESFYLRDRLAGPEEAARLQAVMESVRSSPGSVETLWAHMKGRPQLLAVTWLPELSWHVVSAVDLKAAEVLEATWVTAIIAGLVAMFGVLLVVFAYGVDKMVLRPLNRLHKSATALADGDYEVLLPPAGNDEIGDLSRAFSHMVEQVKVHTRNLEEKVRERTRKLEKQSLLLKQAKEAAESATSEKSAVLDKVMESIQYARTIQQAILTTEAQLEQLAPESFVIWQPKDVISGDMIWSRAHADGFALAVLDCTGHGVPGGVMTMAAVSALDRAASEIGLFDPARVLQNVSRVVRKMLSSRESTGFSEDGLDMGLCVYHRSADKLLYAGSRMHLFYGAGEALVEIKGDRESLGYPSSNPDHPFKTHTLSIQKGSRFYLATDGIVDQVGGQSGLPLGKKRFLSFLNTIQDQPMADQREGLCQMFAAFKAGEEQRDDVTVVGFRLHPQNLEKTEPAGGAGD